MQQGTEDIKIDHNESTGRFEACVDGQTAFVHYRYSDGGMTLVHTEVPAALGGRGLGSILARAALEYARNRGLKVTSTCPFVTGYINRHPEYQSLLSRESD